MAICTLTIRFSDDIAARLEGPQLRDPKDEMVLETTMNGQADALVTFNVADFRDAMTRFSPRRDDAFGISWRTGENVMSNFALRMPESLHAYAKKLAQQDNTSLNQFIVMAVAEKVSALNTEAFFQGTRCAWHCGALFGNNEEGPGQSATARRRALGAVKGSNALQFGGRAWSAVAGPASSIDVSPRDGEEFIFLRL